MTTRITSFSNDIVIQKYLNGKTLDQIAKETSLSKGTVYNLVKRWKVNLESTGVEEIREFAIVVNKSEPKPEGERRSFNNNRGGDSRGGYGGNSRGGDNRGGGDRGGRY